MFKIQNSFEFKYLDFEFIWDLVLGIWCLINFTFLILDY